MNTSGFKAHHFSIIGKNTKCTGDILFEDASQVWGEINGNIQTLEKIEIERTAYIEGILRCHDVIISGKFKGRVYANGEVILRSSAFFEGDIQAENIIVHPGAQVNGKLEVKNED